MSNYSKSNAQNNVFQCAAVIVAAGSGSRATDHDDLTSKKPSSIEPNVSVLTPHVRHTRLPAKQFWKLGSKMVLMHSFDYFIAHPRISVIILVLPDGQISYIKDLATTSKKPVHYAIGGATRQESVRAGLDMLAKISSCNDIALVAIHDAARPLIPSGLLDRLITAIETATDPKIVGAVPVLAITDSIKTFEQDNKNSAKFITTGIDRDQLAATQTPQLFTRETITQLHRDFASKKTNFTDDCSLIEAARLRVLAIDGDKQLMKLTDANDFAILEHWVTRSNASSDHPQTAKLKDMIETRHGSGFDVHKFDQERGPIWLGGIKLDSDRRMLAHSDGDVGIHALCDAIFGALADGDIGSHFPPSDPEWKDTDSATFLSFAAHRVAERGGEITHLDLTFICENPKINPHRDAMRKRIAEICGVAIDRVSVKATTSEGLGFTGRSEGIAAQASATISLPASSKSSLGSSSSAYLQTNQTNL